MFWLVTKNILTIRIFLKTFSLRDYWHLDCIGLFNLQSCFWINEIDLMRLGKGILLKLGKK